MAEDIKLSGEAQRLHVVYKEFGGTTRTFADAIGVSHMSVSRMLRGEQAISFEVLKAISYRLGYNPHWFLSGIGEMKDVNHRDTQIISDIVMFQTELQIVNARLDIVMNKLKELEEKQSQ